MTQNSGQGEDFPHSERLSEGEARYRAVRAITLVTLGVLAARDIHLRDPIGFVARLTGMSMDEVQHDLRRMASPEVREVKWAPRAVAHVISTSSPTAQETANAEMVDLGMGVEFPRQILEGLIAEQLRLDRATDALEAGIAQVRDPLHTALYVHYGQ